MVGRSGTLPIFRGSLILSHTLPSLSQFHLLLYTYMCTTALVSSDWSCCWMGVSTLLSYPVQKPFPLIFPAKNEKIWKKIEFSQFFCSLLGVWQVCFPDICSTSQNFFGGGFQIRKKKIFCLWGILLLNFVYLSRISLMGICLLLSIIGTGETVVFCLPVFWRCFYSCSLKMFWGCDYLICCCFLFQMFIWFSKKGLLPVVNYFIVTCVHWSIFYDSGWTPWLCNQVGWVQKALQCFCNCREFSACTVNETASCGGVLCTHCPHLLAV